MANVPAAQYLGVSSERQEYSLDCRERTPTRRIKSQRQADREHLTGPVRSLKPGVFALSTFPSVCVTQLRCWLLLAGTSVLRASTSEHRPSPCPEAELNARLHKKNSSLKAARRSLAFVVEGHFDLAAICRPRNSSGLSCASSASANCLH